MKPVECAPRDLVASDAATGSLRPLATALVKLSRFIACLCVAGLIALPVLEIALRVFTRPPFSKGYIRTHPTRHYELTPNYRGMTYDVLLEINSQGMRDVERAVDPHAFRVAVFGDSLTFGQGVELSRTYTKRLEARLAAASAAPVQVFNFSVPGFDTGAELSLLRDVFDQFKPQLVIFQFTVADDTVPMVESASNGIPAVRMIKDLLRKTYVYDYLAGRFYGLLQAQAAAPAGAKPATKMAALYDDDYPGWVSCQRFLGEIAAFARDHQQAAVFALFNDSGHIAATPAADPAAPTLEKLDRALDQAGLSHHLLMDDGLRAFAGREALLHVRPDDMHFNAAAHDLLAEYLFNYLRGAHLASPEAALGGPH